MNKKQENKQTMWEAILKLFNQNKAKVDANPGFASSVAALVQTTDAARKKISEADNAIKGKAQEKAAAEDALIATLVPVLAALRIHAHKENHSELWMKVDLSPSDLKGMRDTALKDVAVMLIALANEYTTDLVQHGIGKDKLDDLQKKADTYFDALSQRLGGEAVRGGARAAADELVSQVDQILTREIDDYMEMMQESDPEFYNTYWSVRHIRDTGIRHRSKPAPAPVAELASAK
ncbi:MAG: hypothetical protein ABR936_15410 [Bacteroidota bacterium]